MEKEENTHKPLKCYNCYDHYCPKSNTCEWYILPTIGEYLTEGLVDKDCNLVCYKEIEITIRSI
jgi:hypothetical protein